MHYFSIKCLKIFCERGTALPQIPLFTLPPFIQISASDAGKPCRLLACRVEIRTVHVSHKLYALEVNDMLAREVSRA